MRIARTGLVWDEVRPRIRDVVTALDRAIPSGVGAKGAIPKLNIAEAKTLLRKGAAWAVAEGFGTKGDLDRIEDGGVMSRADPDAVSDHALRRGLPQVGTLGSGNHFLEIERIDRIYDAAAAKELGLFENQICIAVHSGSRGFGYQICDDFVKSFLRSAGSFGIDLIDRQLACAPVRSQEGQRYLSAMACAANYAWVNRQVILTLAGRAVEQALGMIEGKLGLQLVYDVCHNIAKIEEHEVDGQNIPLVVHRKGATRAFPPGHPALAPMFQKLGQPVFVPGDMGRSSFLLLGLPGSMKETFGSSCHGAGRVAGRKQMVRQTQGRNLSKELEEMGVYVRAQSRDGLAEEMPEAYKDAEEVVNVLERAGISKKVVRLRPVGVVKG